MNIAIIGTGISGLTAAYILNNKHDVSVFEANNYIGGHTNTIEVNEQGRCIPVDTGFIVFNEHNYPNLCRLFNELNVESRETEMSFSVSCHRSGLEYNGTDLDRLFIQRSNIFNSQFWKMLMDIMKFHKQGPNTLLGGIDDNITVDQFAEQNNYGRSFIENYLIPLGASLWSCPAHQFRKFPMRFVLEFLDNHCMLQVNNRPAWRTVKGGSYEYVKAMTSGFRKQIHLNSPVQRVERKNGRVELTFFDNSQMMFDEVILATHADQSMRLVADMDETEKSVLSYFPYNKNEAILHTDETVLPSNKRAWASWNYTIPKAQSKYVSVAYNMNILQGIKSEKTYIVSLNQSDAIKPEHIIRKIDYDHPLFIPGRDNGQSQQHLLIQRRGISYCGAYWGYGFHEDGVRSALAVTTTFNMDLAA